MPMSLVLARYYEIDPSVRSAAIAVLAGAVALVLGIGLWFSFRNRRK